MTPPVCPCCGEVWALDDPAFCGWCEMAWAEMVDVRTGFWQVEEETEDKHEQTTRTAA